LTLFTNAKAFLLYSCDADPDVLAQYVLALLKNNKPSSELKVSVIEQLEDFLKDRKLHYFSIIMLALISVAMN
jgi:RNA-binding protein 26